MCLVLFPLWRRHCDFVTPQRLRIAEPTPCTQAPERGYTQVEWLLPRHLIVTCHLHRFGGLFRCFATIGSAHFGCTTAQTPSLFALYSSRWHNSMWRTIRRHKTLSGRNDSRPAQKFATPQTRIHDNRLGRTIQLHASGTCQPISLHELCPPARICIKHALCCVRTGIPLTKPSVISAPHVGTFSLLAPVASSTRTSRIMGRFCAGAVTPASSLLISLQL
jgi:hypothetical protein